MRVTAYARYALQAEIEQFGFVTCFFEEGDEERAETAVNVEKSFAF